MQSLNLFMYFNESINCNNTLFLKCHQKNNMMNAFITVVPKILLRLWDHPKSLQGWSMGREGGNVLMAPQMFVALWAP